MLIDCGIQLLFGLPVKVEGGNVNPRLLGNVPRAGALKPLLGKQLLGYLVVSRNIKNVSPRWKKYLRSMLMLVPILLYQALSRRKD